MIVGVLYSNRSNVHALKYPAPVPTLPTRRKKSPSLQPTASVTPARRQDELNFPALIVFTVGQQPILRSNLFILSKEKKTFVLLGRLRQIIMSECAQCFTQHFLVYLGPPSY